MASADALLQDRVRRGACGQVAVEGGRVRDELDAHAGGVPQRLGHQGIAEVLSGEADGVGVGRDRERPVVEEVAVDQYGGRGGDAVRLQGALGLPLVAQDAGGGEGCHDGADAEGFELGLDDGVAQGVLVRQGDRHGGVGAPGAHPRDELVRGRGGVEPLARAREQLRTAVSVGVEEAGLGTELCQGGGDAVDVGVGALDVDGPEEGDALHVSSLLCGCGRVRGPRRR